MALAALLLAESVSACVRPSVCKSSSDCGAHQHCDEAAGVCRPGRPDAGVAGVSSSSSASPPSSSATPSSSASSALPACPQDCGDAGPHARFTCDDAGACLSRCDPGFGHCDGTPGCPTELAVTLEHCGTCEIDVTTNRAANACQEGLPVCGRQQTTCATGKLCFPSPDAGAPECFQCIRDADCPPVDGGARACCGGTCTPLAAACGCSELPRTTTPGIPCNAGPGPGGLCLTASGTRATGAALHSGACGCIPQGGGVVPADQCGAATPFLGLCVDAPDGRGGSCLPQNNPARPGGQPVGARNCGRLGNMCTPFQGGFSCVADDAGVGACRCIRAAAAQDVCAAPAPNFWGFLHVTANTCSSQSACTCGPHPACDPDGPTPECSAGDRCIGYYSDPANCGAPGVTCAPGQACGNADAGLVGGQCGCSADAGCPSPAGGGRYCLANTCVCPNAENTACPAGTLCSGDPSGCCERGIDMRPNSCPPPVAGYAACPLDIRHPHRRICYALTGRSCCDEGCDADGHCLP